MDSENFFQRWAKRKSDVNAGRLPSAPAVHERAEAPAKTDQAPGNRSQPSLTLTDVAALNADSDYSVFLAEGVQPAVRRAALKKLFSNPGFHVIDGLDIHMEDYNKTTPIPAAMLAALRHTQSLFNSMAALEKPDAGAPDGSAAPALPDGDMTQGEENAAEALHAQPASDVRKND